VCRQRISPQFAPIARESAWNSLTRFSRSPMLHHNIRRPVSQMPHSLAMPNQPFYHRKRVRNTDETDAPPEKTHAPFHHSRRGPHRLEALHLRKGDLLSLARIGKPLDGRHGTILYVVRFFESPHQLWC